MANHSGVWDPDHWIECGILALLLLYAATNLLEELIAFLRVRGIRGHPLVGNNDGDGNWRDLGETLAMPSALGDLWIPPNIDPEGQYNVWPIDQPPAIREPVQNIDAANVAAAEVDLNLWLTVAEVASLPRQIERDEENMMVTRRQVPSSVDDATVGDVLPHRIEDEDQTHAAAEKVATEDFPPGMLELISGVDVTVRPQFAEPSVTATGGLESNLEERMPVNHPEAGDSADFQVDVNAKDDVAENLEVEEPHAEGML